MKQKKSFCSRTTTGEQNTAATAEFALLSVMVDVQVDFSYTSHERHQLFFFSLKD